VGLYQHANGKKEKIVARVLIQSYTEQLTVLLTFFIVEVEAGKQN
jgi:hypothetical protein